MPNHSVINFLSHDLFFLKFFIRNYPSKSPWAKESAVSTNMTSIPGPIHLQTLISSYHHILILLYKPNATVIMMPLWVKMMKHKMD